MYCLLYILVSVWVLRTPNAGRNSHFQRFLCKKPKKARILQQISAKNRVFLHFTKTLVDCFTPKKVEFCHNLIIIIVWVYELTGLV